MIYIASPYSSPIPELVTQRVAQVTAFVDQMIAQGFVAFSPIMYCHPIAKRLAVGTSAGDWMAFNMDMLRRAEATYFLRLPGWENSRGMSIERNVCKMLNMATADYDADFRLVKPKIPGLVEQF